MSLKTKYNAIIANEKLVVIAGTYKQYMDFLQQHLIRTQALYVTQEEQLYSLQNVEIVRTGEFWKNPVNKSDLLEKLIEEKEWNKKKLPKSYKL